MNLLVYYSLEGNCEKIAQCIEKTIHCDVLRLETVHAYPTGKISKFIYGGKSVLLNEMPKLKNGKIDVNKYDKIILGTPIWASSYTPPILTFIHENALRNKQFYFFATHKGGGATKCFSKLEKVLTGNKICAKVDFVEPIQNQGTELDKQINEFCKVIMK